MIRGASEDTAADGRPAEIRTLTTEELNSAAESTYERVGSSAVLDAGTLVGVVLSL